MGFFKDFIGRIKGDKSLGKVVKDLSPFIKLDPDSIFNRGAVSFIYDPKSKNYFYDYYPQTHEHLLNNNKKKLALHFGWTPQKAENPKWAQRRDFINQNLPAVLGRVEQISSNIDFVSKNMDNAAHRKMFVGSDPHDQEDNRIFCIGFWNAHKLSREILKEAVEASYKHVNYLPLAKDVIIFGRGMQPFHVAELSINVKNNLSPNDFKLNKSQESPVCKNIGMFQINGKSMDLGTILANLHMVKGKDIVDIKNSFCVRANQMEKDLEKAGCEKDVFHSIYDRLGCDSYTGKDVNQQIGYGLRDMFRGGEDDPLGKEFRTQKELNAAWDRYQRSYRNEHQLNFKKWLH